MSDTTLKTITVNGRDYQLDVPFLSYASAVALSGLTYRDDFTVTYRGGTNQGGMLRPFYGVALENGMVLNVVPTDNA